MGTLGWYALTRTAAKFVGLLAILMGVIVGGQLAVVVGRGVPFEMSLPLFPSMAWVGFSLSWPLALSAAVLISLGNMNRDGELRALASCGISHIAVILRLFPLVLAGVIASAVFFNVLLPEAIGKFRENRSKMAQAAIAQRVAAHDSIDILGFDAWARAADGQTLTDLFMFLQNGDERTALFAHTASWSFVEDDMILDMPDVQILHKTENGSVTQAHIKNYRLQKEERKQKRKEPDSMQTTELLRLYQGLVPAKDRVFYNNARLSLHLRVFAPLSLVAFVLFAAGLAVAFASIESLLGVGIMMLTVAATTYPAIAYVKKQNDHPHLDPGWLLWPPALVLAIIGILLIWRPDRAHRLAARPVHFLRRILFRNPLTRRFSKVGAIIKESGVVKLAESVDVPEAIAKHARFGATLDRFVLRMTLSRWILAVFIGVFLLMLADFIGNGFYVRILSTAKWYLVPLSYLVDLPQFVVTWLPMSVAAAALIIATPMLRQGGLLAMSSAGVPPRRVFMGVLAFSVAVGCLSFSIKDQVVPRLVDESDDLKLTISLTSKKKDKAQVEKKEPNGWRGGDYFWCAQHCVPSAGYYENVAVFGASPAGGPQMMAMADSLRWIDGDWELRGATVVQGSVSRQVEASHLGELGIPFDYDRAGLSLAIRPDIGKTCWELFRSADTNSLRIMVMRISQAFLPALCLLFALPGFIRWENRLRMGQMCGKSILFALIPIAVFGLLSKLLISMPEHLLAFSGATLGGLFLVGGWRWRTMHL